MRELQRLLDQLVAAGAPGAAGWVQDDNGAQPAASGVADLRTGGPMRPELHFRAGSLTKSLVATVVLQLVAEGRLSLQDSLDRRLPGILPYGEQVTLRQLLNHTSGVPHNWATVEQTLYRSPGGRSRDWTPRELVALVADQPPDFPPGTAWSYSNTGYHLLGLVVEAAGGSTLGQELHRRIVAPLGLHGTSFPESSPDHPEPALARLQPSAGPAGEAAGGSAAGRHGPEPLVGLGGGCVGVRPGGPDPVLPGAAGRPAAPPRAAGRDAAHRHGPTEFHPTPHV
jgi:D-alanyl-D-alanine carboxypeptidase